MNPHDANVFGTVHGGQILTLMEETGAALATKYCNQAQVRRTGYTKAFMH